MILSDRDIRQLAASKDIIIEPFDDKALGSNSYDVHLGANLMTYAAVSGNWLQRAWRRLTFQSCELDAKKNNPVRTIRIGPKGFVLKPGVLYLGVTQEYTETKKHVPFLDGKSSIGRLGIWIHCTAGRGDVGFSNHWTLEIAVVHPVRVYAGMPIGQLIYMVMQTEPEVSYAEKTSAKYNEVAAQSDPWPTPSYMYRNFVDSK